MKMRSDNTVALQGLPTGRFSRLVFIPNKRQKASQPVATGIGRGQLWARLASGGIMFSITSGSAI